MRGRDYLLANHSSDSDVEDIVDRSLLHHRSVDLVVFPVLISCHPVSQPSKRGREIFVGESFGGRQGEFNWAFNLMADACVLLISLLGSLAC